MRRTHPTPALYPSDPYEYARALWFEEYGDTALVGTVLLVMEVRTDHDETAFYSFSNDKRQWIQRALIQEAQDAILLGEVEER